MLSERANWIENHSCRGLMLYYTAFLEIYTRNQKRRRMCSICLVYNGMKTSTICMEFAEYSNEEVIIKRKRETIIKNVEEPKDFHTHKTKNNEKEKQREGSRVTLSF